MSRVITAAATTASKAGVGHSLVIMCEFDFESGFLRIHTGGGNFKFDGNTFVGLGGLAGFDSVKESVELGDQRLNVTLSGLTAANISTVFNENIRGRRLTCWAAFFDSAGALVASPVKVFRGRMDTAFIKVGKTFSLTIACDSALADWNRARSGRFTDEDQQARFAGDLGLQFVAQQVEKTVKWGVG